MTPEAMLESLPATLLTPWRTLSLTSSMSGALRLPPYPAAIPGVVSWRLKYSAEEMEDAFENRVALASGPPCKRRMPIGNSDFA